MKDKKLQVFVSSTFTDLKEERQAAVEAILSSGHIPAGMELFAAGDESQMAVIERWIDESDVYLLILGGRYGSVEPKSGKSYTQLEYEYALSKGKPHFAVVINKDALDKKARDFGLAVVEQDNSMKLNEFKELVTKTLVKFWDDKKDIKLAVHETLSNFVYTKKDLVGWIRGDNAVNTAIVAEEIARLTKENAELRERIERSGSNALYVGFSYKQLEEIQKREELLLDDKKYTAFEVLMAIGSKLIHNTSFTEGRKNKGIVVLEKYKLIMEVNIIAATPIFKFTDDGHAFYLKALYYNTVE